MSDAAGQVTTEPPLRAATHSAAYDWWRGLQNNNGARARLRRCRSSSEALMEPAAINLAQRLGALTERARSDDFAIRSALDLARVLAHVKENEPGRRVMQQAGWKKFPGDRKESDAGDQRPDLSEIRFRRLMTTEPGEPLVAAFTRLVRQLEGKVNVTQLARDFRRWSHPTFGPQVRQQWAFDYYAAGLSAPRQLDPSTDDEATP